MYKVVLVVSDDILYTDVVCICYPREGLRKEIDR
jgi:hypothetical protein